MNLRHFFYVSSVLLWTLVWLLLFLKITEPRGRPYGYCLTGQRYVCFLPLRKSSLEACQPNYQHRSGKEECR